MNVAHFLEASARHLPERTALVLLPALPKSPTGKILKENLL